MRELLRAKPMWFILTFALVVRLAAGVWWQGRLEPGQRFHFPDSESYWELGRAIAAGGPYEFRSPDRSVFRAPGLPVLLAPIFLAAGPDASVFWGRAVSAVCGTVAVGGVYFWARHAFDIPTANVAAGIAAVYPGSVAMSGLVLSEAPFTAAMVWQLALWRHGVGSLFSRDTAAERSQHASREKRLPASVALTAIGVGVLGGFAALIRPSWLLFTPLGMLLAVCCGRDWRRRLGFAALAIAALGFTMLPWWIRNWHVTGHFVPTTLQVGASLYDGLNPAADGGSDMSHVDAFAARHDLNELNEYELDGALRQAAFRFARENPGAAGRLALVKFARLWNVWPNEPSFRSWPARLIVAGSFMPVMILAAMGVWHIRRRLLMLGLCLGPAVYFTALHMVFVSSIRYRQPAMLPLIVLAASAIVQLVDKRRRCRQKLQ